MDSRRITITGKALSVRGNDIDTDRIIPARYLRCVTFDGIGAHVFEDDRSQLKEVGRLHPFDDSAYAEAEVLFVNRNFGCGSSREHAPQAIMRWGKGVETLVGESFAEIFFGNCVSLGIPCVTVDEATMQKLMSANEAAPDTEFTVSLQSLTITYGDQRHPVYLADSIRQQFLEGRWDVTGELLGAKDQITQTAARLPYFNDWA